MGLPGEDLDVMLSTIDRVNELPVDTVKIHQLQLVRGTRMARDVESGLYDIPRFTAEEYVGLCVRILQRLRKDIAVERFVSQSGSKQRPAGRKLCELQWSGGGWKINKSRWHFCIEKYFSVILRL